MKKKLTLEIFPHENPDVWGMIARKVGHNNFKMDVMYEAGAPYATLHGMAQEVTFEVDIFAHPQVEVRRKWKQRNRKHWR